MSTYIVYVGIEHSIVRIDGSSGATLESKYVQIFKVGRN